MEDGMEDIITDQPGLSKPSSASIVNSGLTRLASIQQFVVKQHHPKCLELLGCWEYNNRFSIMDTFGNELFNAREHSSCCMRICCTKLREFSMPVTLSDDDSVEVLTFERPLNCIGCCLSCCYPSCMQSLMVMSGDAYMGKIIEYPTCWIKRLEVFNSKDEKICDIVGPCIIWRIGCNNLFQLSREGVDIGNIEQEQMLQNSLQ